MKIIKDEKLNSSTFGFFQKYKKNYQREKTLFIQLETGFLRLKYADEEGNDWVLSRVSFVQDVSLYSPAIGEQLEFSLSDVPNEEDEVTFIKENAISGTQWYDGKVNWGCTLESDDQETAEHGKKISLEDWVDECVNKMIHPGSEIQRNILEGYQLTTEILDLLKRGDKKTEDKFWKECTPKTHKEVELVLDLVFYGANQKDSNGDLIFTCIDPLKRSTVASLMILSKITELLESNLVKRDFERSKLMDILNAHAKEAIEGLVNRWLNLCKTAYQKKGLYE